MRKGSKKGPQFHLKPLVDLMGMDEFIKQIGVKPILEAIGAKRVIEELKKSVGKPLLDKLIARILIKEVGAKRLIDIMFPHFSAEKRAELLRGIKNAKVKNRSDTIRRSS